MKRFAIFFLTILMLVVLAACDKGGNTPSVCQHRDADDNSLCDKCGESYTDDTDVTPEHTHAFGAWEQTVAPTCQAMGVDTRTCACGHSETRDSAKDMTNHVAWGEWGETTPATCQTKGVDTRTCACGHSETRDSEKNMSNHVAWGEWKESKPATYTELGEEKRTCACGAFETRETPTLDPIPITGIAFTDGTLSYNGTPKSIYITGSLPTGVTATYMGNGQIVPGTYTVTVTFTDTTGMYVVPANMTATMTVVKDGQYHDVIFRDEQGAQIGALVVKNGEAISASLLPTAPAKVGYDVAWNYEGTPITADVIIVPVYTFHMYEITYVIGGAQNDSRNPATYTIDAMPITLYSPACAFGQSFMGWYTSANFDPTTRVDMIAADSAQDYTLYAKFANYRIEAAEGFAFDYENYELPAITITVPSSKTLMMLSGVIQVSEGCTWSLSKQFDGGDPLANKNMSLAYGHNIAYVTVCYSSDYNLVYILDIYRLSVREYTFISESDTFASGTIEEQGFLSAPDSVPQKTSYHFVGWSLTSGGTETVMMPYQVHEDTVLYAVFAPNTYHYTYNVNGGDALDSAEGDALFNSNFTLATPTRTGYTFKGWRDEKDAVRTANFTWTYTEDMTFTAVWQVNTYTVTYNYAGGSHASGTKQTVIFDAAYTLREPTRVGYTFKGYAYDGEAFEKVDFYIYPNDITLIAQWELNFYTITYVCASDVDVENMPSSFTIENESFQLNPQSKDHYTFRWEIDNKVVDFFDTSIAKNVVVNGIWTPIEYQITYNLNGGTGSNRTTHNITTSEFSLNQPIKDGYTFVGWTGSNGSVPEIDVVIPAGNTEDLSYKANWTINTYSITYVLFGGNNHAKNPDLYSISDTIELKDASKEGYRFEGWYMEVEFENEVTILSKQHVNLVLYAKFTPLSYSATFEDIAYISYKMHLYYWENSEYNKTTSYKCGDSFDLYSIEVPAREGYFFGGWFMDPDFKIPACSIDAFYSDVTLYAKWDEVEDFVGYRKWYNILNPNPQKANFKVFELTSDLSYSVSSGISRPTSLGSAAETYSVYFYVSCLYAGEVSISYSVGGNRTTLNKKGTGRAYLYDVTEKIDVFDVERSGSSISGTITATLKAGHYYRLYCYGYGYSYRNSTASSGYSSTSGYASISISGVKKTSQKIIFSNIAIETYDSEMVFPTASRAGYDFIGWYDEHGELATGNWTYTTDQRFYANWDLHNYSIEYVLDGGVNNLQNPLAFTINDEMELQNASRAGYAFDGWYSDSSYQNKITTIDGKLCKDMTLYAKWIPNT